MVILEAKELSKSYGLVPALHPVSVRVGRGDRLGIVGPNGMGKTTLLRIMAGLERPDTGSVVVAADARVGYVGQEIDPGRDGTVRDYLQDLAGLRRAERRLEQAAVALARPDADAQEYDDALRELESHESTDGDIEEVVRSVGLERHLDRRLAELSGGQAARIRLSAILLAQQDLLLLDEPTNDLDFRGLARLEDFLASQEAALVVVSHDREFLDRIVTRILAIEAETGRATEYQGGYREFERARQAARHDAEYRYRRWTTDLDRNGRTLRSKQDDARRGGAQADRRATRAAASKVRAAGRRVERLRANSVEKPWRAWELRLSLTCDRVGDVVRLADAVIRRGAFELPPLTIDVGWGDRLLLTGPNGCGKSTLIDAIKGELPLVSGSRWVGAGVRIGSLDQARDALLAARDLVDFIVSDSSLDETQARTLLGHFNLLEDDVDRACDSLTPGERTRAMLALLQAQRPNFLVLDEPTNHLDAEAIDQLESALSTYEGAVLLVTHDRRMISRFTATRSLALTSRGLRG